MILRRYLAVSLLLFAHALAASEKVNQDEARTRLEQAVSKTNILELPSFSMNATVHIQNHGKPLDGTYQLLWNGPDQWREGISLPGYSEVQVGGKGQIWLQRSSNFMPLPIYALRQALGIGSNLSAPSPRLSFAQPTLSAKDRVARVFAKKQHGANLTCFEIENDQKISSEVCLDTGGGTIVRDPSDPIDSDLQPVGDKVFPRRLSYHTKDETVNVNVTQLDTPARFPSGTFTASNGISAKAGCMTLKLPQLIKRVSPKFPRGAFGERLEGTVAIDAVIGADGVPQLRAVVESSGRDVELSAKGSIVQWRYDPATCNGQPVETEIVLQVNYALGH